MCVLLCRSRCVTPSSAASAGPSVNLSSVGGRSSEYNGSSHAPTAAGSAARHRTASTTRVSMSAHGTPATAAAIAGCSRRSVVASAVLRQARMWTLVTGLPPSTRTSSGSAPTNNNSPLLLPLCVSPELSNVRTGTRPATAAAVAAAAVAATAAPATFAAAATAAIAAADVAATAAAAAVAASAVDPASAATAAAAAAVAAAAASEAAAAAASAAAAHAVAAPAGALAGAPAVAAACSSSVVAMVVLALVLVECAVVQLRCCVHTPGAQHRHTKLPPETSDPPPPNTARVTRGVRTARRVAAE